MTHARCDIRARLLAALALTVTTGAATLAADESDARAAEAEGRIIGRITFDRHDVFDLSDPREDKPLYRLANRLHVVTKERVIAAQLLLEPGDAFRQRLADESERILRANNYLYDAKITPVVTADGGVDLEVTTRDVWTLLPAFHASRKGGENTLGFTLEESNLAGRGQKLALERREDVDRDENSFQFRDKQIGSSWVGIDFVIANNSDGHSHFGVIERPFYALDARWSAGVTMLDSDSERTFYALGERSARYREERRFLTLAGGWSRGLENGWVRRYRAGFTIDDRVFSAADGDLPPLVPPDRELAYPFVGIEILEDRFTTTENREQIARTEDIYMGTRLTASLGWASPGTGADRDALVYRAGVSRGFGSIEREALLLSAAAGGRIESGASRNATIGLSAKYFRQQSEKRVFFATLEASRGHALDLDNPVELGGDTGLRGYPLRYQAGDSHALVTVEQRYFWDWYPWRLFRVGGAIFADAGRTWGTHPAGGENLGWLKDVGIGLRFASPRGGVRKVVHLDLAFPLDGDASIDEVQILLESKKSF
ncbi:MAG: hypothetical protein R3176_01040 [Woeseiaceae bacterium]|nr:hypothetical protein [Woeseiaceae bacterium]